MNAVHRQCDTAEQLENNVYENNLSSIVWYHIYIHRIALVSICIIMVFWSQANIFLWETMNAKCPSETLFTLLIQQPAR